MLFHATEACSCAEELLHPYIFKHLIKIILIVNMTSLSAYDKVKPWLLYYFVSKSLFLFFHLVSSVIKNSSV